MQHLILTRLASGSPSKSELLHRLMLFYRYCAPGINRQTCKEFKWIIAVSQDTPEWFTEAAGKAIDADYEFLPMSGSKAVGPWARIYPDWAGSMNLSSPILTTRMDGDDGLHKDFISTLQWAAEPYLSEGKPGDVPIVLDFPNGHVVSMLKPVAGEKNEPYGTMFASLLEFSNPVQTIYCSDHTKLQSRFKYVVASRDRLWLRVHHGRNVCLKEVEVYPPVDFKWLNQHYGELL